MNDAILELRRKALVEGTMKLLVRQKYFSICDFDKLLELAGVTCPRQIHQALSVLHCIDYAEMDKRTRELVTGSVTECLRQNPDFPADIKERFEAMSRDRQHPHPAVVVEDAPAERSGLLRRLLSC